MAAVVRVKRRIDEEPLNAFILNCKKRKIEDEMAASCFRENLLETKDEISTILKFAGTVESQEDNIGTQIRKLTRTEANQLARKSRKPNITEKNREDMKQTTHENRFKVVNCYRTIHNDDIMPREITVVDIEKQDENTVKKNNLSLSESHDSIGNKNEEQNQKISSTPASSSTSQPTASAQDFDDFFVYDLYLPETSDTQNINIDYNDATYLSVRPFDDLVYEDRYNNDDDDDYLNSESEDSNAEDNWKNDYPDTEDSISEKDMRGAANNYDEDNLSSDENEYYEGYVHSINTRYSDFEDDMDFYNGNRRGRSYLPYFSNLLNGKYSNSFDGDNEDGDDEDDDKGN